MQRIFRVARHQVDVSVINGLPGGLASFNNNIETSRRMTLLKALLERSQKFEAPRDFSKECKNALDMHGRDD